MATDLIRYDLLVQDAMRGVMRKVLTDVAETGYLPGEHHFTIIFRTDAPGVKISRRLQEQWPHELTIILQYQFSNLIVDEDGFGVTLSFRSIPETLYVPFAAVTGFFDPSVEFGLRFDSGEADAGLDEEDDEEEEPARPGPQLVRDTPAEAAPAKPATKAAPKAIPAKAAPEAADGDKPASDKLEPATAEAGTDGDAKVVSIDAFRKKT